MEAYSGRGGEVRRVNIIYFISRIGGHVDHPHLLRVHRLSTNGVRLRDIKRWLSVVRGKDMPESYAWSYKRRYKAGYVWQDLLDEDLITPISDNEYVLKGSEIYSSDLNYHGFSSLHITDNGETIQQHSRYTPMDNQTKPLIENHAASPLNSETATLSMHDSTKLEETKHLISKNEEIQCQKANDVPFYLKFLTKIKRSMDHKNIRVENANEVSNVLPSNPHCSMMKGCSKNGSTSFRNLMTCFLVDTKDSAIKTQCRSSRVLEEANGSSKNKKNEK